MAFSAEEIPDGDTRFKCAPPIRDSANKEKLWNALMVEQNVVGVLLVVIVLVFSNIGFFSVFYSVSGRGY